MKNIRLLIFDFGGTLVRLYPSREDIISDFLASKELSVGISEITKACRIVDHCKRQSSISLKGEKAKEEFLLSINKEVFKVLGLYENAVHWSVELYNTFSQKKKWDVFEDTIPLLKEIEELGLAMAILANWDKNLESLVNTLSLNCYFSHVSSSEQLAIEKPDPRIFYTFMRTCSFSPDEALYIGNDYELDAICARSAGVYPILIDRLEYWPYADCLRFKSLMELREYLKSI
ncbi:phosphoglycolate phosphatase [bacterium BMS3Abin07]|nr:phosphoglycolate phosphatase [bacterium BMS3Abin07]GBE32207.1 phosphoglycolate phosphatase [bacterium BMS3Bbin05]